MTGVSYVQLGLAECPRCHSALRSGRSVIPGGPMQEDEASVCSDPYGVHVAWELLGGDVTRLRTALEEIAAPPVEDDSGALDILQEHWAIAAAALTDSKSSSREG